MRANSGSKSQSVYAVVTRADGRVENKGLVAFYHKNPVIHFVVNAWIKLKEYL